MSGLAYARPEEIGLDAARLQVAYDLLDRWTIGPEAPIPGAALAVGRRGRMVEPKFFGRQGPEGNAPPIRRDGAFLLASITKPVVYLAAMMLVERGELSLADPVSEYLPDFVAHHKEQTLVFHLFTHTSGLPDMLPNNVELRRQHAPLARFVEETMHAVPLFPPGTQVSYQSMGTLITAAIVERIAGQTLPSFLQREVFEPLDMSSSSLGSDALDPARLVRVRIPAEQREPEFDWNSDYWRRLGSPWGGMFSAPDDFASICQLMLDGGRRGDVQLLSPAAVEQMTTNRLNDLPDLPESVRRTQPWGLGWKMHCSASADSFSDLASADVYGHWGATGTMCWIDPGRQGFCLFFTTAPMSESRRRMGRISNVVAASFL